MQAKGSFFTNTRKAQVRLGLLVVVCAMVAVLLVASNMMPPDSRVGQVLDPASSAQGCVNPVPHCLKGEPMVHEYFYQ